MRWSDGARLGSWTLALALGGRSEEAIVAMSHGSPFFETSERLGFALRDWYGRIDGQAVGTLR